MTSSSRLAIDVSSTTSRSASISSLVGPSPGIQPSAEWIVDASIPVDSAIRRAARPVGATSAIDALCALAAAQISRIVAVLPVPGPPVTIEKPRRERRLDRGPLLGGGDEVRARAERARRASAARRGEAGAAVEGARRRALATAGAAGPASLAGFRTGSASRRRRIVSASSASSAAVGGR